MDSRSLYLALKDLPIGSSTCRFTEQKCQEWAPIIARIKALKKEKNTLVLAHSYVSPEILLSVADVVGDSYELSKKAKEAEADNILFIAVKFMAETAKVLNPEKNVYIPGSDTGCSLADAISEESVISLKKQYPQHSFVCYINTTAAVKAYCDVCVTSSNVYTVIENIPNNKIYFLPDKLMGQNIKNDFKTRNPKKEILYYEHGTCYVHEAYDADMISYLRLKHPHLEVVSHPECAPPIIASSDYVGSTTQMLNHVRKSTKKEFFLLTECGLSSRLQIEMPEKKFIGTCSMCKFMKSNTLENILETLESPNSKNTITLSPQIIKKAKTCIDAMFHYA